MDAAIPVPAPEDPQALATTEENAQEPDTDGGEGSSQPSDKGQDDEAQSRYWADPFVKENDVAAKLILPNKDRFMKET